MAARVAPDDDPQNYKAVTADDSSGSPRPTTGKKQKKKKGFCALAVIFFKHTTAKFACNIWTHPIKIVGGTMLSTLLGAILSFCL
jgi:hypothetical protein